MQIDSKFIMKLINMMKIKTFIFTVLITLCYFTCYITSAQESVTVESPATPTEIPSLTPQPTVHLNQTPSPLSMPSVQRIKQVKPATPKSLPAKPLTTSQAKKKALVSKSPIKNSTQKHQVTDSAKLNKKSPRDLPVKKSSIAPIPVPVPSINQPSNKAARDILNKIDYENINEQDESNITTKVYKSSDPSTKLLEEQFKIDTTIEDDLINKDELLAASKNKKDNYVRRLKINEKDNSSKKEVMAHKKNLFLPWISAIILILILYIIFKTLKKLKL